MGIHTLSEVWTLPNKMLRINTNKILNGRYYTFIIAFPHISIIITCAVLPVNIVYCVGVFVNHILIISFFQNNV